MSPTAASGESKTRSAWGEAMKRLWTMIALAAMTLSSTALAATTDARTAAEFGMMHNRTPRSAVGVTLFVGLEDHGNREGLKARYRQWLAGKSGQPGPMSVELSAVLFLGGVATAAVAIVAISSMDLALGG
jgi:hypothetical protein